MGSCDAREQRGHVRACRRISASSVLRSLTKSSSMAADLPSTGAYMSSSKLAANEHSKGRCRDLTDEKGNHRLQGVLVAALQRDASRFAGRAPR